MVRIQKINLLFVLLLFVTTSAHTQELKYRLIENKTDQLEVYNDDNTHFSGDIVIPSEALYNSQMLPVNGIAQNAFNGSDAMISISIPASVNHIGSNAFSGCTALTKATFASIAYLCAITFDNEYANPLRIAKKLYIGENEIKYLVIPNGVSTIGKYAFAGAKFDKIQLSTSITNIGDDAFRECVEGYILEYANFGQLTSIDYGIGASNPMGRAGTVSISDGVLSDEITINVDVKPYAFKGAKWLKKVTLSEGITGIGAEAFLNCKNLKNVVIPQSVNDVNNIGLNAFRGSALENVEIKGALVELPGGMFRDCTSLTNVILPKETQVIGERTFQNCPKLTTLPLPQEGGVGLKTIGKYAFAFCGFESLEIPNSVVRINECAFSDCSNLKDLVISPRNETSDNANKLYIYPKAFSWTDNKTSLKLQHVYSYALQAPEVQPYEGNYNAFDGNTGVELFTQSEGTSDYDLLPWSNTNIFTQKTFRYRDIAYYVDGSKVNYEPSLIEVGKPIPAVADPERGNNWEFAGWQEEIPTYMPDGEGELQIHGYFTKEYIAGGVKYFLKSYPKEAIITGCSSPVNVSIGASIKPEDDNDNYDIVAIEDEAFKGAESLTKVDLSGATNLSSIGNAIFEGCSNLTDVTLPDSRTEILTKITDKMFYGCAALSTLDLPESVETIGASAFAGCKLLSTLVLPDNVETIGTSAFNGCEAYNIDHLPTKLETLGESAFYNSGIVKITLPKSIKTMGNSVFKECTKLEEVTFEKDMDLTKLPDHTFNKCSNLAKFSLPTNTSIIGNSAFYQCSGLKLLVLDDINLTTIGSSAFHYCTQLASISLPATTATLQNNAFSYCPNVVMITIESADPPSVVDNTFSDAVYNKASLCVKDINKYKSNDTWSKFVKIESIASSPKLIYKLDGEVYCEVEQKTGTPVEPQAAPNADSNPKGRAFSGWKDEPKIMPNKDSVIVGSLKYLRTYKAEGTTDVLYSDSLFYGYEVRHPDNDLKKDGLSYTIIKPFETMPAKDSILYVSYSLTTAPTPSSGLIFNNANQDLISKGSSKTGTLKYSLDKITFVETKPTGKNAKEYTVYFRVDGVTEHYNTEPDSIVGITIAPKPIEKLTITLKENENGYTYNGYPHKPEVKSVSTRINNTETEIPKDEYKVDWGNNINAGTEAKVYIEDNKDGNYTIKKDSTTFVIKPAKGKLSDLLKQQPTGMDKLSYTGVAQDLITVGIIKEGISGNLKYSLDKITFDTAIPQGTDAKDDYTVHYMMVGDPNYTASDTLSLTVAIKAKEIAISKDDIILEYESCTYNGEAKKPLVTVKTGETAIPAEEYTVSYADSINAGTATVTVTAKKGRNYKFDSVNKTYKIMPKPGMVSDLIDKYPQPVGDNITYNANPQNLIKAGTIKKGISGSLKYSLDKIAFETSLPQGTDAKEYTVYYMVDGDPNYTASDTLSLKMTINPKSTSVKSITLTQNSYTYDGTAKEPTVASVTVNYNNLVIGPKEYKVSYDNNINATNKDSKAQVMITDSLGGNFIIESKSTTFEIKPAKGKLSDLLAHQPTGVKDLSYTGAAQNLITAGTIDEAKSKNGKLKYSLDNKEFATTIPQGTKAQDYTVYYKVEDDPNYTASDTLSLNVTINAKKVSLSADNIILEKDSYTYDGTAKKPAVTVKTGETTIPAEEYTVSYADSINAGTATVTVTAKKGSNYDFASVSKTYKITPKFGSLAELIDKYPQSAGDNITYSANAQNLIKAGTIKKGISGSLKYSLDKIAFDTSLPQGTDAKEYTVYYMVEGDPNYTASDTLSLKVTILPRSTSVSSISLEKDSYIYDGTAKKPAVASVTVKFNNLVVDPKEYTVSYQDSVNAGTATVIITGKEGGNYSFESASKTYEIKPAKGKLSDLLTQKPTGIDKLSYTGAAQNLIAAGTIDEAKSKNGKLKYSLDNKVFDTTIPQGTKAQDYTVYYKVEDDPNYTASDTLSLTVTINAKKVSLSADNITLEKDSYTYDGTAKKPGVTVKTGETTIPAEEYTVSYADSINAGTATVTVTAKKGSNYMFDSVNKTYKITPAASSLTNLPTAKTNIVYNGTAQELINKDGKTSTGTLEYSLSQDKVSFKETIPTGTNAGSYTVYYRVKGDANHSDSEIGSVKATIAPKEINSFSLSQSSYTYAGSEIKPDVIVEFNKQAISKNEYTVSYSDNKNVGTATVTVTDNEGGNFTVSGSKTFTIAKAPLTISADSYDIFEGDKIPVFTIKYDGFVNNETEAVLTAKPIVSCNATATSKAGDYTISVGGSKAANYNITHKSGKLTIIAMKFVSGGESSKDEDDAATYQITSTGKDVGTTPTVAIVDDKDVGGAFAIPEAVTYHNTNYKVTEINESAFENNKYLTEVSIPSSITNIGDKAFKGCSNLKSITVYITTPISLAVAGTRGSDGASVFEGVDKTTCVLYVPDGSVELYKAAPVWCEFKHIVPISTLTGINGVNVTEGEPFDIYNLQGRKVKSKAYDLKGLPRGIYIINGKKVAVK